MAWLDFIIEKGYLDPEQNPEPVLVGNGFSIPRWESLTYLERISEEIKKGQKHELIDSILKVIKNVSEHPKDNYHTWYVFIKILSNIPKEKIPVSIFDYMPVWFNSRFDTMLQSSEVIHKLLPQLLTDTPSADDVLKAEAVLGYLFSIQQNPDANPLINPGKTYYSRVYLYYLKELVTLDQLKEKIIKHLSSNLIYELMNNINFLLRDYSPVAEFVDHNIKYQLQLIPRQAALEISIKKTADDQTLSLHNSVIENYFTKSPDEILEFVCDKLKTQNIGTSESLSDALKRLSFGLKNDFQSIFGHNPIQDLGEDSYSDNDLVHLFSFILREFLLELAAQKPDDVDKLLRNIIQEKKYQLPFFKRMIFYIIAHHWDRLKDIFFGMIEENDAHHYFSKYVYHHELHHLLSKVQLDFDESEIISGILNKGPQSEKEEEPNSEIWKHRWLHALRENPFFKEKYDEISKKYDLGKTDYSEEGKVRVRVGSLSPLSADEILEMNDEQLVQKILSFKNGDRFEEPSIDGFADQLMKAAEKNPQKFIGFIENYMEVPYLYIYYLLNGIIIAWRNQITFDWKELLNFCDAYLNGKLFKEDKLVLNDDGFGAKQSWVFGAIGRLISEGTRNDNNAFDYELLPLVKKIILDVAPHLQVEERRRQGDNIDYPALSLNSTPGQFLRGALDYSLRKARAEKKSPSVEVKWEPEIREIFNSAFSKGIIEGYILIGMYFQHFYYLDKEWTERNTKEYYFLDEKNWLAFMGGLSFSAPAWNKDVYQLLYPHYNRALENNVAIDTKYHHGLIRHITAYYFWNYDILDDSSLMVKFINNTSEENIDKLIQFLRQQEKSLKTLSETERNNIKSKVVVIWERIILKYEGKGLDKHDKLFESLISLINYIDFSNNNEYELILKLIPHAKSYISVNIILEKLVNEKKGKNITEIPALIGKIITNLPFSEYMHDEQQKMVKDLVVYLFENGQQGTAEFICNKLTIMGYDFLKEVFYRYK